jgi:tetratricopeptide (TPR) repeat protein
MFYWVILSLSGLFLLLLFWKRYSLMCRSLAFEQEMKKEEARTQNEEEVEIPTEGEPSDLQKKRHEEQRAREEKTKKIRQTKKAYKQAEIHFDKGDYGLAEKHLLEVLSIDNDHLDANLKLGLLYLHQENLPRSEFFFQKLIDLKESPVYYSNLALTLFQQKRLEEASKLYEKAIELDPKRAARFISLAHVYHELGELERALMNFEKATELEPRNLDYLWILVDYYEKFSRVNEVIRVLNRVLELDPYNDNAKGKLMMMVERSEMPSVFEDTPAEEESVKEGDASLPLGEVEEAPPKIKPKAKKTRKTTRKKKEPKPKQTEMEL